MSLGVLNNINAIYAQNNLNNTSNSLSKVLQQLSSGSKISSGADDAAGLSLVNGLQANHTALVQSTTNATEGVGLLSVADGALSQVTNLLNRAVTLATEASNGTLNSSQDTAANQEYQSILSEISNIGTTTTYNQNQVFGSNTNIYTGDSSSAGASIDALNIRSLSASNVGDSVGQMSYANASTAGTKDIFINTGATGSAGTAYATTAASSLSFSYLTSNGTVSTKSVDIAANSTLAQVAADINNSGLGLTATVTTAQAAGDPNAASTVATKGGYEGIQITGSFGVAANTAAASAAVGAASSQGLISGGSTALVGDTLTGSITIQTGTNTAATINMTDVAAAEGSATFTTLATYINANSQYGVTASNPGAAGTISLQSLGGAGTSLNVATSLQDTTAKVSGGYTATNATSVVLDSSTVDATYAENAGTAASTASVATIGYTDAAGVSLAATDLTSQSDAQTTLKALNSAIAAVAAQDGYIGAQINTLNSVSSVLSTQSENVVAAQNAVQATDYASATSNMSKYQILSQTGISALAQANSMQQEVTKLLQ